MAVLLPLIFIVVEVAVLAEKLQPLKEKRLLLEPHILPRLVLAEKPLTRVELLKHSVLLPQEAEQVVEQQAVLADQAGVAVAILLVMLAVKAAVMAAAALMVTLQIALVVLAKALILMLLETRLLPYTLAEEAVDPVLAPVAHLKDLARVAQAAVELAAMLLVLALQPELSTPVVVAVVENLKKVLVPQVVMVLLL